MEQLLVEVLTANLKALKAQAEVAGSADYVRKQPANGLAVLYGVIADKMMRILSALEPAEAKYTAAQVDGLIEAERKLLLGRMTDAELERVSASLGEPGNENGDSTH